MIEPSYGLTVEQIEARRSFLGASEARIIMEGCPEKVADLIAVKRGEKKPKDLSSNRAIMLGHATESLNRYFYMTETGVTLTRIGEPPVFFRDAEYIGATLDGFDPELNGPFEAKFHGGHKDFNQLVDWYYWQLQQQMLVTGTEFAALSVIFGANAQYDYRIIAADGVSQWELQQRAERVWECVQTGKRWPELPPIAPPAPKIIAHRDVPMDGNNEFAIAAGRYLENRSAAQIFGEAEKALKAMMPADAKAAYGYGLKLKRSKNGAITIRDVKQEECENV